MATEHKEEKGILSKMWGFGVIFVGVLLILLIIFSISTPLTQNAFNSFTGFVSAVSQGLLGVSLQLTTLNSTTSTVGQSFVGLVMKIGVYLLVTIGAIAIIKWVMAGIKDLGKNKPAP